MMNLWIVTTGKIYGIAHMKWAMNTTVHTSKLPIAFLKYYHISLVLKNLVILQRFVRFQERWINFQMWGISSLSHSLSILLLLTFVRDSLVCGTSECSCNFVKWRSKREGARKKYFSFLKKKFWWIFSI